MARILVVEDSPTTREQLKDVLVDEGHEVDVADGGREALAKVGVGDYDLVLTDLWMPEWMVSIFSGRCIASAVRSV